MTHQAIVVGSKNAEVGIEQAMAILRAGGSPLDAVVAGIREVERNPEEHYVGYSSVPNLLGEVELDASVMEGHRLAAGAVGALRGHRDAVELARRVMERLPHVLIVGDGAGRLAGEVGLPPVDPSRPRPTRCGRSCWREGKARSWALRSCGRCGPSRRRWPPAPTVLTRATAPST